MSSIDLAKNFQRWSTFQRRPGKDKRPYYSSALCSRTNCQPQENQEDEFHLKAMALVRDEEDLPKVMGLIISHKVELFLKELEWQENERKRSSKRSQRANDARHGPDRQAKKMAIKEWEANLRSKFLSMEKAGIYLVKWLIDQGLGEYQPRTVTKWLRDYAHERGIRLR